MSQLAIDGDEIPLMAKIDLYLKTNFQGQLHPEGSKTQRVRIRVDLRPGEAFQPLQLRRRLLQPMLRIQDGRSDRGRSPESRDPEEADDHGSHNSSAAGQSCCSARERSWHQKTR